MTAINGGWQKVMLVMWGSINIRSFQTELFDPGSQEVLGHSVQSMSSAILLSIVQELSQKGTAKQTLSLYFAISSTKL